MTDDDPYQAAAEAARREFYEDQAAERLEREREPVESPDSAPTARTSRPGELPDDINDSVIYAWQMLHDDLWNIIGLQTPSGQTLPMVTTSFEVAWNAFDIAQEHATRHATRCRLAAFKFETLMAVVVPNDQGD